MAQPIFTLTPKELKWLTRFFIFSLVILIFSLMVHPLGDPDVYIHLRDGRYWLETGWQVGAEPFAYTVPQQPFEKVEWLFRIGVYLVWKISGYNGLILAKASLMTISLVLLGWLMYRRWPNLGIVGCLIILILLVPMTRYMFRERPYLITYLFLPLVLGWLDSYQSASQSAEPQWRKRLWWIPALIIPWANLHPGFVVVFVFLGGQIIEMARRLWWFQDSQAKIKLFTLLGISGAGFLAAAINPLGFSLYGFIWKMMHSSEFMRYILEWAPPTLSQQPDFFFLLALVWLLWLFTWQQGKLSDLVPIAFFSYLAIKSYRNIPLFIFAAYPWLVDALRQVWKKWPAAGKLKPLPNSWALILGSLGAWATLLVMVNLGHSWQLGEIPRFYPAEGLAWIEQHALSGRILTHDIWGGYTGWQTHGRIKIFMDGRLPTFGEKLYSDYRKMIWGDPNQCLPLLDHYDIQAILVSPKNEIRLFQQLWNSQQWALVYWDDVCLLYVRRSGANQGLIQQFEYQAVDPKHTPYYHPKKLDLAFQEILRAKATAPHSFLPYFFAGEFYLRQQQKEQARQAFQKVLTLAPQHTGTHFNLGHLAYQEKKFAEAEQHFRLALRSLKQDTTYAQISYYLAATLMQDPSRWSEARVWAEKACRLLPNWEPAQNLLRELRVKP